MAEIQESGGGGKGDKVRVKKKTGKPDMTPMVDLGFLLITFFMYTTTFSKPNTMKLNMPKKDNDEPEKQEMVDIKVSNTITVIMGKDNRIFWYQKPLTEVTAADLSEVDYSSGKGSIREAILQRKANALDQNIFTVIIKPTDEATWENTVDILDEMAITKCEKYAVVDLQDRELQAYNEKVGNAPSTNQ